MTVRGVHECTTGLGWRRSQAESYLTGQQPVISVNCQCSRRSSRASTIRPTSREWFTQSCSMSVAARLSELGSDSIASRSPTHSVSSGRRNSWALRRSTGWPVAYCTLKKLFKRFAHSFSPIINHLTKHSFTLTCEPCSFQHKFVSFFSLFSCYCSMHPFRGWEKKNILYTPP